MELALPKTRLSNHGTEPIRDLKLNVLYRLELGNQEAILELQVSSCWFYEQEKVVISLQFMALKLACYMHIGRTQGTDFQGSSHVEIVKAPLWTGLVPASYTERWSSNSLSLFFVCFVYSFQGSWLELIIFTSMLLTSCAAIRICNRSLLLHLQYPSSTICYESDMCTL